MHALLWSLAIAGSVWLVLLGILMVAGRASAAREVATLLPNLVRLFKGLIKDPRVPRRSKLWLWVAVAWVVSPIDLVPEFLPVIGPLDDAVMAAIVLRHIARRAGTEVIAEHWHGSLQSRAVLLRIAGLPANPTVAAD
jgi:uncharacterized membrane protein YkvA (DUF1232 family)